MGEIREEIGLFLKVFLVNLWKHLDTSTRQGILVMIITTMAALFLIAVARWMLIEITRDGPSVNPPVAHETSEVTTHEFKVPVDVSQLPRASSQRFTANMGPVLVAMLTGIIRSVVRLNLLIVPAILFLLLAAFGSWPYNFYILTRVVVCLTSVWFAIQLHSKRRLLWEVAVIAIALIFNPVTPFHLDKHTWRILNILGAIVLAPALFFFATKKPVASTDEAALRDQNYCTHCGSRLEASDSFCGRCGVALVGR